MSPRTNTITTAHLLPVPTPAPLFPTHRGQFTHLPSQLLPLSLPSSHPPLLLQIPLLDWHKLNRHPPLTGLNLLATLQARAEGDNNTNHSHVYSHGLKGYCALSDAVLFLCSRRAGTAEFVTDAPGKTTCIGGGGVGRISPAEIGRLHEALGTDFVFSPADSAVLPGRTNALAKRVRRAEKQVEELVEECGGGNGVFVSVQGGDDVELRKQAAKGARKDMSGYCLDGFYAGEGPEVRWKCIEGAIEGLGKEGVRVLTGGHGSPGEVLRAVGSGVDVVEGGFPFEMAVEGYAMDLRRGQRVNCRERGVGGECGAMVEGCGCGVCKGGFSKGYVRHLLEVHEMMGATLLAAHNMWDYLEWFGRVREAIREERFEQFVDDFEQMRLERRMS